MTVDRRCDQAVELKGRGNSRETCTPDVAEAPGLFPGRVTSAIGTARSRCPSFYDQYEP
jgi:hypothetical protein